MFGIGFSELAIIALVLVVFIRPDDLPAFFRKMGKIYGQLKRAYGEITAVKDQFLREMDVAAALKEADKPENPDGQAKPDEYIVELAAEQKAPNGSAEAEAHPEPID
ncbi:MAG TPA: hypothetical protein VIO60_00490 [Rectinemataceae bacterium]